MTKYLSTTSVLGTLFIGALLTPMFAFALPCVRTVSSPSSLNDMSALFARFR